MTRLPDILARHGINQKVFEEELFPLVEMPSPQLCADRLDYALRDAVSFGKLAMEDARRVVGSLKAFPSATATRRLLVLDDPHVALILSRAYITTDKDVWSSPAHIDMCQRTGRVIGELVEAGSVDDKVLWQASDAEFWTLLRQAANPEQLCAIERLEEEGIPEDNGLRLPHCAKIRTLDPDVWQGGEKQPAPLSIVLPTWGSERQQYILSRSQHR
jgi:HD superfamily phosphohydrolase